MNLESIRGKRIAAKKAQAKKNMNDIETQPYILRNQKDVVGTAVWSGALWLFAGSRSNPLVKPLANIFYDADEVEWVKDRNEGLFTPLPPGFMLIMGLTFTVLGVIADRTVLLLAEGDSNFCLQLAGVSLIGGGALELGRIASGEKGFTREDFDRTVQLKDEFIEFAKNRLIAGGNCHRSDVVKAFRRYYAKYRVENEEYPLADIEVERLMKDWNRKKGNEEMTPAGFFKGVQINLDAEAF